MIQTTRCLQESTHTHTHPASNIPLFCTWHTRSPGTLSHLPHSTHAHKRCKRPCVLTPAPTPNTGTARHTHTHAQAKHTPDTGTQIHNRHHVWPLCVFPSSHCSVLTLSLSDPQLPLLPPKLHLAEQRTCGQGSVYPTHAHAHAHLHTAPCPPHRSSRRQSAHSLISTACPQPPTLPPQAHLAGQWPWGPGHPPALRELVPP